MKTDRHALIGGIVLLTAIPALLLWQSSNSSKGTGPGYSKYNVDQFVNTHNIYFHKGEAAALDIFCDYALDRDRNYAYTATWIEYVAAKCGECADVHAARGRMYAAMGNREMTRREFEAARAAVRDEEELQRMEKIMERYGKWTDAGSGQ